MPPTFIPHRNAFRAPKFLLYAASCLLALAVQCAWTASARAVMIHNITTNTTLFSDDFELQSTVASGNLSPTTANINGVKGNWSVYTNGSTNAALRTTSEANPGSYQGTKYLKIIRDASNSHIKQAIAGGFTSPISLGDELLISFAYNISGDDGGAIELQLYNTGTDDQAMWISSGGTIDFYGPSDGYDQSIASSVATTGTNGVWHSFALQWTVGDPDVRLNIDSQGWETVAGAVEGDALNWIPDRMAISTTRPGIISYDYFVPNTPGDYNLDGIVDSRDYVAWRKNPSAYPPDAYEVWRANFGSGGGTGGSGIGESITAPEPTAAALCVFALATAMLRRRTRSESHAI